MCRPHGTAFLPLDVCRRKEKKEQKKERKGKQERKERKAKNSHTQTGYPIPHHHYRTIEPNQPPHLLTIFIIFSSSHIQSSKNPTISMLNSNLAYQKKSARIQQNTKSTFTQKSSLSREAKSRKKRTYTSPDNDHVHTPNSRRLSAPQSFRLRRDNMSNVDKVPTSLSRQTH